MKKLLLLLSACAVSLFGQPNQNAPDCIGSFAFNATGPAATFTNTQGCVSWTVVYNSTGFSALSLVFQSAPGTSSPGTWVTYAGTVATGTNPNTSTTGAVSTFTNGTVSTPFLRMDLASATGSGSIQGTFYGWRTGSGGGGGGGGGGCTAPCVVIGPDAAGAVPTQPGVQVNTFDGVDTRRLKSDNQGRLLIGPYPSSAAVSLTSSGLTQLVAASGSTVITLGGFLVSFASAVDFQFEYGTGSACGTGTTAITGVMKSVLTVAIDSTLSFSVPAGNALCANLGSSVTGGGIITYNQQ